MTRTQESKGQSAYRRVLLKMSGEVLAGDGKQAIDPQTVDRLVQEIAEIHRLGVQVGVVIGGGNFFRGVTLSKSGISRITGDHMGMLATLMNALALRDAFERVNIPMSVSSAIPMSGIVDTFNRRDAMQLLDSGSVVLFAAGTGNPLVTTDSAASLRGIEVGADVILKATNVDGIYSADPNVDPDATLYRNLTFQEVLQKELGVMDLSAFCQCRDHDVPIVVFNIKKEGALKRVILGESEGTRVSK